MKEAQAIFRVGSITPILMQKEVAGFINLRGKVVVAVGLRQGLRSAAAEKGTDRTISLEKGGEPFALLVDRVGDVLTLSDTARTEIPPHCDELQARYTRDLYVLKWTSYRSWTFSASSISIRAHPQGIGGVLTMVAPD